MDWIDEGNLDLFEPDGTSPLDALATLEPLRFVRHQPCSCSSTC